MSSETINEIIANIDTKYNLGIGVALGISVETNKPEPVKKTHYSGFKLPITFLSPEKIHPLPQNVSADLEMVSTNISEYNSQKDTQSSVGIYDYILQPKHQFAKQIIQEWNQQFTTDIDHLKDTQNVIANMGSYLSQNENTFDSDKCKSILEIWADTKEDSSFLEKYCYLEWDMVKHLNKSSHFLQSLTLINMSSPIMSFIIPIIFLIFPFIILKIQRVPITFSVYIKVLQDIAKNHFIGKALSSFQSLSWDKIIYILITIGLYFLQIYQNINLCYRFYRNIRLINSYLITMREYLDYSIQSMDTFCQLNQSSQTYSEFLHNTQNHSIVLKQFQQELSSIRSFEPGFSKISQIGYLLKCFYELHSNAHYEDSLRYSMGFEGYINNLTGIYHHLSYGKISNTTFSTEPLATKIKKQYYAVYIDSKHVKNNCDLSNNIIITGPNASGKTTMLKSTAINIILSQQFGMGCFQSCVICPYTHIHSYLNIPDTSGRDSLFQLEAKRCRDIIDIIRDSENARHFTIYDELFSGTNPTEAVKSGYSLLLYLSKYKNVDFILTTHYISLCKKLEKKLLKNTLLKGISNYKMIVNEDKLTSKIKYTYVMKPGISKIQGAILVLEEMNYPKEILDEIKQMNK